MPEKMESSSSSAKGGGGGGGGKESHGLLETGAVVLTWFALNIAMGSSTKWIFLYGQICQESPALALAEGAGAASAQKAAEERCQSFKFPLTVTVIHMLFSWIMCWIQLTYFRGRPKGGFLTIRQQLSKIAPLSICFSLSVAMGNLSLKYIFPSFNQMLGAMSPLITVALAMLMQRKRYNWWTWGSMPIICGGLVLCTTEEVNFNALGAMYATGATVLRAVKSIMQGRLLSGSDKMDSVTLLFYMAPWAGLFLQFLALLSEGLEPQMLVLRSLATFPDEVERRYSGGFMLVSLLIGSGLNACLLNVANFMVTAYTSPLTLQVLGNVKSCLSIAVSVAIFRNPLTMHQGLGVLVCLFGVWLYNQKGGAATPSASLSPPASDASKRDREQKENFELRRDSSSSQVQLGEVFARGDRTTLKEQGLRSP